MTESRAKRRVDSSRTREKKRMKKKKLYFQIWTSLETFAYPVWKKLHDFATYS